MIFAPGTKVTYADSSYEHTVVVGTPDVNGSIVIENEFGEYDTVYADVCKKVREIPDLHILVTTSASTTKDWGSFDGAVEEGRRLVEEFIIAPPIAIITITDNGKTTNVTPWSDDL